MFQVCFELFHGSRKFGSQIQILLGRKQLVHGANVVNPGGQGVKPFSFLAKPRELGGYLLGAGLVVPEFGVGGLSLQFLGPRAFGIDVKETP
jgi:hypothetical protein